MDKQVAFLQTADGVFHSTYQTEKSAREVQAAYLKYDKQLILKKFGVFIQEGDPVTKWRKEAGYSLWKEADSNEVRTAPYTLLSFLRAGARPRCQRRPQHTEARTEPCYRNVGDCPERGSRSCLL